MLPGRLDYLASARERDLVDRVLISFTKFASSGKPVALPKPIQAPVKLSIQDRARLNSAFKARYRKSRYTAWRNRRYLDKVILGKGKR